jgi:hypothetical protein
VSSLAWYGFGRHKLSFILCLRWYVMGLSTHVDMHFVSSLAWDWFDQHMLRCIFCPHLQGRCLLNTCSDIFCFLSGKCEFWSTHVEMHNEASLAYGRYGHHMLRCIFCPQCHGMGLVNTCCYLEGNKGVRSTHVDIHFLSSLAWEGFGQHKLRFILYPRWHGIGLSTQVEIYFVYM